MDSLCSHARVQCTRSGVNSPTYGAGPAAASVFVLSLFGVPQATALAFAALWWLISQVPCALIGVPAFGY